MVKARALALFAVLALLAGACDLPRLDDQRERPLAQTSSVYASDGSLITDLHATDDRSPEAMRAIYQRYHSELLA